MKTVFEDIRPDIMEQELAGESAMRRLFAITRRRFRELQRDEGLSQQQLAERMELKPAQISKWFASPSNMTVRTAAKLLMAMGRQLELSVSDPYVVAMSTPSSQSLAPISNLVVIDFAAARAARDLARSDHSKMVLRAGKQDNWQLAAKAVDRPEGADAKPKAQAKRLRWLGEIKTDSSIVEFYCLGKMVIVRGDAFSDPQLLHLDDCSYPLEAVAGHSDAFYVTDLKPTTCERFISGMATSPADHSCSWK